MSTIYIDFYELKTEEKEVFKEIGKSEKSYWTSIIKVIKDICVNTSGKSGINYSFEQRNYELSDQRIHIVFTQIEPLCNQETFNQFRYSSIRKVVDSRTPLQIVQRQLYPIIFIGAEDIMQVHQRDGDNFDTNVQQYGLDKRFQFLDADIWHYYVPLFPKFKTDLKKIIDKIARNWEYKLYQTNVAREYLELQLRMLSNSYILEFGSGHAKQVIPFHFHSEQRLEELIKREKGNLVKNCIYKILLVDDYAEEPLKAEEQGIAKTKLEIIKKLLDELELKYEISYVSKISEAKSKLNNEICDVVLLDYLFTKDEKRGTEFIKFIEETDSIITGPLNKIWIFPISSFSFAIISELYVKAANNFSEKLYLDRGADPINHPALLKLKLLRFLKVQGDKCGLEDLKLTIDDTTVTSPSSVQRISNFAEYCSKIFMTKPTKLNKQAAKYFPIFVLLHSKFLKLNDIKGDSLLARSILEQLYKGFNKDIWQHFLYLTSLLAYGSGLQWQEMWQEYTLLKKKIKESDTATYDNFKNVFGVIEQYIVGIKN